MESSDFAAVSPSPLPSMLFSGKQLLKNTSNWIKKTDDRKHFSGRRFQKLVVSVDGNWHIWTQCCLRSPCYPLCIILQFWSHLWQILIQSLMAPKSARVLKITLTHCQSKLHLNLSLFAKTFKRMMYFSVFSGMFHQLKSQDSLENKLQKGFQEWKNTGRR